MFECSICSIRLHICHRVQWKACSSQKSVPDEKNPKISKETWFDQECKNLLREHQVPYEEYCHSMSNKWSTHNTLRTNPSQTVKRRQRSFHGIVFSHLTLLKNVGISLLTKGVKTNISEYFAFGELKIDRKIAERFILIFSNLGQNLGKMNEEAPSFSAGDSSFSFRPKTQRLFRIIGEKSEQTRRSI